MAGRKMEEFRKYIDNVMNNFTTLKNNIEVQMGIYNICDSTSVDGECRFNATFYVNNGHSVNHAVITYAVRNIHNFQ